ncbi:MAG TPA: IucA/IucC family C-terminal-domain containing protein [Chloroflexaceae bacterium]|nr:IucA/IucC family C-terminal-domain containing protein [Chloroflexaceae bacterium]
MMVTQPATAPLFDTMARLNALDADLLGAAPGPLEAGWFRADALLREGAPELREGLARQAARYAGMDRRTAGSFFVNEYAWYVFAGPIGALLAERRAPELDPANLALRFRGYTWEEDGETGEAERIDARFLSGRCAVLPDDPAAGLPGVTVLSDEGALREWLRAGLEAHVTPLIERVHAATRLGRRAQWNLVADACAGQFLNAGKLLGDPARAQAEGLAFVRAAGSPMCNPGTGYITLECAGHTGTFRARGGCCRYYTVGDGDKCTTCVLRPAEERDQRLREYLARQYAVAAPA